MIKQGYYISMINITNSIIPPPPTTREFLEKNLSICSNRHVPRLIEVERVNEYRVFICVPNGKSNCDYVVWRYSPRLTPELKIPTHDDLGLEYIRLKSLNPIIEKHLINSVMKLVKDRWPVTKIIDYYFNEVPVEQSLEIEKFLATLKWIALQEDVNYPPPRKLGSKFTLAVYILIEGGFNLKDIRRMLRF